MSPLKRIVAKKIGDLLTEKGIINKEQLEKALEVQRKQGGLLGTILVSLGYAKEEEIAQVITVQYGFPYLPLTNYDIDPNVIKVIPEDFARQHCLVAIDKMSDTLTIAMANPLHLQTVEDTERMTGCKVHIFVSTMTDINNTINKYYKKK